MKKIDKLILSSFLGPMILTFMVVVFILLMQNMLKYFDDIIGKNLGWDVIATLMFYMAVVMTPIALPLAILLSSLITFGNLGEHFELTAVKSLGISLVRSLAPISSLVIILTFCAYLSNNFLVPKAALEAYSLLYDIKQKKPALDLREGEFNSSIPNMSIKVDKRFPDGKTISKIVIYDHRSGLGNREVTVADSGQMFTILNDRYLKLELFNGYHYSEGGEQQRQVTGGAPSGEALTKTKFDKSQVVFDLSSFELNRTDKRWFQSNRIMRNMEELEMDMDSVSGSLVDQQLSAYSLNKALFSYHKKDDSLSLPSHVARVKRRRDSLILAKNPEFKPVSFEPGYKEKLSSVEYEKAKIVSDSLFTAAPTLSELTTAVNNARSLKGQFINLNSMTQNHIENFKVFQIQWHKILSNSIACFVMFLIGAPLGAIIKKGGIGVPVLASILFFIVFYVLNMMGEKWAKQGFISVEIGVWMANFILAGFGVLFLRQARADARLFEADFYNVIWDKFKTLLRSKKLMPQEAA
ncbi:MAG: YjgP/YjgQ family permease [Flammeovirgaceae bacterium]|nr:YjgP/YjgQ family permease [Flammeovirgaceae bacterium]